MRPAGAGGRIGQRMNPASIKDDLVKLVQAGFIFGIMRTRERGSI